MLYKESMRVLKETSRTFYIPIQLLQPVLKQTVGAAYLCMRALDEIEDHEELEVAVKVDLLLKTGELLKPGFDEKAYAELIKPYKHLLPEVTIKMGDWVRFCPEGILPRVLEATREMAAGMANWTEKDFVIETEEDLDDYTYHVAGLVGSMLSDIWVWYDGIETDKDMAIAYGRGLQAVNILRNKDEDMEERNVNFFPNGWTRTEMFEFAERNLKEGDKYVKAIGNRQITLFSKIPLALAKRTLQALKRGEEKMTRKEAEATVEGVMNE